MAPSLIPAGMRTSTRRVPEGAVSSRVRVVPRNASSRLISASPSTSPPRRGVGAGWRTRPLPAPVAPRAAAEPRPKTSWKKSEKGLAAVPKRDSRSSGETVRYSTWGPPAALRAPGRPAPENASYP